MKDGYFDQNVKSARSCMKKFDEFIVARRTGHSGRKKPDPSLGVQPERQVDDTARSLFCLLSCIELGDAQHYVNSNNLQDDPDIVVFRIGVHTIDEVDL